MKIIKHLSERNFLFLAVTWTVFITVASLVSFNSIPKVKVVGSDKVVHFLFYLIFVVLWSLAKKQTCFKIKYSLLIVVIAIVFGIIIEILQGVLTQNRQADVYDALANSAGAFLALLVIFWLNSKTFQNKF